MFSRIFHWLQSSTWSPYIIIIALLFGIFGGLTLNKAVVDYYYLFRTPQQLTITEISVTQPTVINKARELNLDLHTPSESFYPACDRLNFHILVDTIRNHSYPLEAVLAGGNFTDSLHNPHISINLPNTIPAGDYNYHIRTIYFCNVWPIGMVSFHSETNTEVVHLDPIVEIPLTDKIE